MARTRSRYYTTDDIAWMFSVQPKTVRRWIRRGHLAAVRLGRQWRIAETEVNRFLEVGRRHGG